MKRQYHGWIFAEKSPAFKDKFNVQWNDADGANHVRGFGYGEMGASDAVAFFETAKGLNLGPVRLEVTPLGLRVFTEVKEATLPEELL